MTYHPATWQTGGKQAARRSMHRGHERAGLDRLWAQPARSGADGEVVDGDQYGGGGDGAAREPDRRR